MLHIDVDSLYDAVIVGGGPAGLTAALYLARARYRVLVIEHDQFGGQITITDTVVNYPGVFSVSGKKLTETMRAQAESFGAEFLFAEVVGLDMSSDVKLVHTSKGDRACLAVLLATGANPRKVGFAGEEEFQGHGVAYCATCDGEFFTGKDVFVVGGGFAAADESVFLTKYARHVTVLIHGDDFTCAEATADTAKENEEISVVYNVEVDAVSGDTALRRLEYHDINTGEKTVYEADPDDTFGVFVFVGYVPATQLVKDIADIDSHGYLVTDEHQQTTLPGLFGAGDVCEKPLRQVATAVGQAATTATEMERYLKSVQERTGMIPHQPVSRPPVAVDGPAPKPAAEGEATSAASSQALFDDAMLAQLATVFSRMEGSLVLRLHVNDAPVSAELTHYMNELATHTDKLTVEQADTSHDEAADLPYVDVCKPDGTSCGLAFHGVPGGHEFTSFVLGLYNAAGPGQPVSDEDRAAIAAISEPTHVRVLVSLACTMCPEVVASVERIAADNKQVTADVYDINHFGHLKDTYNVMSVPCLIIDRGSSGRKEQVSFGKKGVTEILELIG